MLGQITFLNTPLCQKLPASRKPAQQTVGGTFLHAVLVIYLHRVFNSKHSKLQFEVIQVILPPLDPVTSFFCMCEPGLYL